MNFVQRRRFLWICFLVALLLLALTAALHQRHHFSPLRFEDLAQHRPP